MKIYLDESNPITRAEELSHLGQRERSEDAGRGRWMLYY